MLVEGKFAPEQIDVVMTHDTMQRNKESEQFIEKGWCRHLASGAKPWANDLKPTRYRAVSIKVIGGRLEVTIDPCVSYKDFIGSLTPEFEERFGHDFVPDPLALTAVIVTADNKMLVTLRNDKTDYKPSGYHVSVGGFMDTHKEQCPVAAALREVEEETGIMPEEIAHLSCLGAAYNPWTLHTDLIFRAETSLTSQEVLTRAHDDENEVLFIPIDQQSIERWILVPMHANVVITMAAMILFGEEMFGHDWRMDMLAQLARGSKNYKSAEVRRALERRDLARLAKMVSEYRHS
jgi:ADP-ribose pyrophosphatase YjhB (NUDIX family)